MATACVRQPPCIAGPIAWGREQTGSARPCGIRCAETRTPAWRREPRQAVRYPDPADRTADGFEQTMAIHLGHFYLAHQLLPELQGGDSRGAAGASHACCSTACMAAGTAQQMRCRARHCMACKGTLWSGPVAADFIARTLPTALPASVAPPRPLLQLPPPPASSGRARRLSSLALCPGATWVSAQWVHQEKMHGRENGHHAAQPGTNTCFWAAS